MEYYLLAFHIDGFLQLLHLALCQFSSYAVQQLGSYAVFGPLWDKIDKVSRVESAQAPYTHTTSSTMTL